ncbi:MAG: nonstructural protein [Arizlama microvirus]|nr:MAG: nonstructural protein [Arizlama microvirus]
MNLYSIYDSVAGKFGTPWTADNDNVAKRAYERLATDGSSDVHHNPKDFTLYALGSFDNQTGKIAVHQADITPPLPL